MKTIEEGSEEEKIRLSGFYMNHSASTSIFQATHTHSELSNVLLSTRLPNAQIQHGGNERKRGVFGTTSSYTSAGRGTTRAMIVSTIPWQ